MFDKILTAFMVESAVEAPGKPNVWSTWPFDSGIDGGWLPTLAKLVFVAAIFAAISFFLRFLYGPKGRFRDKEMDRQADEIRARQLKELEEKLERGDITKEEFEWRKKLI